MPSRPNVLPRPSSRLRLLLIRLLVGLAFAPPGLVPTTAHAGPIIVASEDLLGPGAGATGDPRSSDHRDGRGRARVTITVTGVRFGSRDDASSRTAVENVPSRFTIEDARHAPYAPRNPNPRSWPWAGSNRIGFDAPGLRPVIRIVPALPPELTRGRIDGDPPDPRPPAARDQAPNPLGSGSWNVRIDRWRPFVLLAIGMIAALWAARSRHPSWAPGTDEADAWPLPGPPAPMLAVGDEAILEFRGCKGVWLALDDESWDAVRDAEQRRDLEEVAFLLARGRIIQEPNGTRVDVLRTPDYLVRVRIRNGVHRNFEAWVQRSCVRRPHPSPIHRRPRG
jgi:hypothetical protein